MRIAVDLGFGFVKAMNEYGDKKIFPSIIKKRNPKSLGLSFLGKQDDYAITYYEGSENEKKELKYLHIGEAGMSNGGDRSYEDKKDFNIEELKILITAGCGLVNPENELIDLIVGLPLSYFESKKDTLKEVLKGLRSTILYNGISGERKIVIQNVFVFPQGAGAYFASVYDINGEIKDINLITTSVGVIDIGYRTVDFLVMSKGRKGIILRDDLTDSLENDGMNKAFQQIQTEVNNLPEITNKISLTDIEKAALWFGDKLETNIGEINIEEYRNIAFRDRANDISSQIRRKWANDLPVISRVIVTGGGGEDLYDYMKDDFQNSMLQENANFANCIGYLGALARQMRK